MTNVGREYLNWLDAAVAEQIHDGPVRSREQLVRYFWGHDPYAVDAAISNAVANAKAYQDGLMIRAIRS